MSDPAASFVRAVAERDADLLRAVLAADVDFKGLTPGRAWEARGPDEVVDVVLGHWFEPQDRVVAVHPVEHGRVADTELLGYGFDLVLPEGPHVVQQQAFLRTEDGRISWMRVVCSGFRPVTESGQP